MGRLSKIDSGFSGCARTGQRTRRRDHGTLFLLLHGPGAKMFAIDAGEVALLAKDWAPRAFVFARSHRRILGAASRGSITSRKHEGGQSKEGNRKFHEGHRAKGLMVGKGKSRVMRVFLGSEGGASG